MYADILMLQPSSPCLRRRRLIVRGNLALPLHAYPIEEQILLIPLVSSTKVICEYKPNGVKGHHGNVVRRSILSVVGSVKSKLSTFGLGYR